MLPTVAILAALVFLLLIVRAEGDESVGFGASLEINDGTASAFVPVPKLTKIGVPNETTGMVESKTLDLPGAVIRKLPTLKDGGTFTFSYEVIGATFDRVEVIRQARAVKHFKIIIPIDTGDLEQTVPGFISANALEDIEAEKITVGNVSVVVTGQKISEASVSAIMLARALAEQLAAEQNLSPEATAEVITEATEKALAEEVAKQEAKKPARGRKNLPA